jgi:hypothetical protein
VHEKLFLGAERRWRVRRTSNATTIRAPSFPQDKSENRREPLIKPFLFSVPSFFASKGANPGSLAAVLGREGQIKA